MDLSFNIGAIRRFLSVRANELQRITVEELKAMPKLSGLDATHNPFACDEEFNQAIQWLTEHGVTPTEVLRYMSSSVNAEEYAEAEGVGKWTDLARVVCDDDEDGPPPRTIPKKPVHSFKKEQLPKDDDSIIPMTGDDGIPDLEVSDRQISTALSVKNCPSIFDGSIHTGSLDNTVSSTINRMLLVFFSLSNNIDLFFLFY